MLESMLGPQQGRRIVQSDYVATRVQARSGCCAKAGKL